MGSFGTSCSPSTSTVDSSACEKAGLLVAYNEALAAAQALPFIEQRLLKILRHEEMTSRHNAYRVTQRVTDAACASNAHQSEHTQLAQRASDEEYATLLQTDVDATAARELTTDRDRKKGPPSAAR
jgi:hypothetical protein